MLKIHDARIQSPSFRPRSEAVDTLVLHYTELDLQASLQILRHGPVSVHYILAEDGTAYRLLEHGEVGFHAGLSTWRGRPRVNDRSIGIEIVNLNGNTFAYPPRQITSLIELCHLILGACPGITAGNVVGHSDIAPKRKIDPGKNFPWQTMAEAGIGLWPGDAALEPVGDPAEIMTLLNRCGYPTPHAYGRYDQTLRYLTTRENLDPRVTEVVEVGSADILRAFQLHFEPGHVTGIATASTMGLLKKLASMAT